MLLDFSFIMFYLLLILIIAIVLVFSSILLVERSYAIEKNSAYECGFHPFNDARSKFDVHFYLVSILFIVFDLEVAFLFPWVVGYNLSIGFFECVTVVCFILVLLIGFCYEWQKCALDWE